MLRRGFITVFALAAFGAASHALADPCKAVPDKGPAPAWLRPGATFSGPVNYIGDGDSLCVAVGATPDQWVEVRLADFYAPELHASGGEAAKSALSRIARNRQADCVAGRQTYDRIAAVCRINGQSIGDLMRAAGIAEGGRGR